MVHTRYARARVCHGGGHSVGAFRGIKTIVKPKRREQGHKSVLVSSQAPGEPAGCVCPLLSEAAGRERQSLPGGPSTARGLGLPGSASPSRETPHDPTTTWLAAQAEHTATAHVRFSLAFWFQSWAFRP